MTIPIPFTRLAVFLTGLLVGSIAMRADAGVIGNPVSYKGHLYFLLEKSGWPDAEIEAVSLGGHLATINDQAENEFVFQTFTAVLGDQAGLWIGLTDVAEEGTFFWTSGERLSYTNWASDEPNDHMGIEDYGHMLYKRDGRPDGSWNDSPGDGWEMTIHGVVEVVPEPANLVTWCLLGLVGLIIAQRRMRARRSQASAGLDSACLAPAVAAHGHIPKLVNQSCEAK